MDDIFNYCEQHLPYEACGFILLDDSFVGLDNIASDKENYFMIEPTKYLEYADRIKAIFHSHSKGQEVSDYDRKYCNITYLPWAIFILPDREVEIIYPEGYDGVRL